MSHHFLIFGHRGSPKRFPENTLASFDEALRAGADGFETDLRLLSDQTAVLFHDDELQEDEIESLSVDQLAQRGHSVQHLRDLAPYARRTTMVLEVKRSRWEDVLLSEISDWPNIIVASFDHTLIAELSRRRVGFPLGITTADSMVGVADYVARLGANWFFPNYRFVDEATVRAMHDRRVRVVPWTPNRPRDWDRLEAAGCDGIITDLPAEAVEWRDASAR